MYGQWNKEGSMFNSDRNRGKKGKTIWFKKESSWLLFIPSFTFDQNPEGLVVGESASDINLGKEEGMTQRYEVRRLFGTKYPGNLQENIWFQTFLDEEETSFADVIPFF